MPHQVEYEYAGDKRAPIAFISSFPLDVKGFSVDSNPRSTRNSYESDIIINRLELLGMFVTAESCACCEATHRSEKATR